MSPAGSYVSGGTPSAVLPTGSGVLPRTLSGPVMFITRVEKPASSFRKLRATHFGVFSAPLACQVEQLSAYSDCAAMPPRKHEQTRGQTLACPRAPKEKGTAVRVQSDQQQRS